jgi:putative transposase
VESFINRLRDEFLNEHLFANPRHTRHLIDDYNHHHRPHSSLDGLTPREFCNRSREDKNVNRPNFC